MACITRQRTCSRLVDKAADLAKDAGWGLIVAHAVHPGEAILGKPREAEAMEELFELAVQYGGEMAVLRDEDPMEALVNYALNHRVSLIVLGVSPATAEMSFADRMRQRLPGRAEGGRPTAARALLYCGWLTPPLYHRALK